MVVFIINYNRLTLLKKTADWCASHGLHPIIIDNHSDYPLLLEYYDTHPYEIIRMNTNFGHKVVMLTGLWHIAGIKERFIITDPDLDFTGVPDDFLHVLNEGLDRYPAYQKCGFSLEIKDLPDSTEGRFIRGIESRYWQHSLSPLYYDAAIDTTFALHAAGTSKHVLRAIRTNRPYTVHHLPWYYTDIESLPEDENYYYQTANSSASGKKRLMG